MRPDVIADADVTVAPVGGRAILGASAWLVADLAEPLESLGTWGVVEPVA